MPIYVEKDKPTIEKYKPTLKELLKWNLIRIYHYTYDGFLYGLGFCGALVIFKYLNIL